jgi:hypothetical protein
MSAAAAEVVTSVTPSAVREKIFACEKIDLVVQAVPAMAETAQSGALAAGSRV